METAPARYKVVGITDERDSCELCGRQNLKSVIVLDADGEFVYYGSECGAKMTGKPVRDINREAKQAQRETDQAAQRIRHQAQQAESARWRAFLLERTGKTEILEATAQLGGFAKARELYREAV